MRVPKFLLSAPKKLDFRPKNGKIWPKTGILGQISAFLALNIDSTINRLSLELSTLQQRLESIEQGRLETLTNNRLLSMLPKSTYFKEEDGSFDQNNGSSFDQNNGSWSSSTNTYPAV